MKKKPSKELEGTLRTHEEYRESLPIHAVGGLDDAEVTQLVSHLGACSECRSELASWMDTTSALAHAAPAAEPSSSLRSRILSEIHAQPAARHDSNVATFQRSVRRNVFAGSFAIAAGVLLAAAIVSLILIWSRYGNAKQEIARLSDRVVSVEAELAREREKLARESEAFALMTSPDARVMTLAGTEVASSAHAKFVFDRKSGKAMLMAYDLPAAPSGMAYQLWYIEEGKRPMPGDVFTTDAQGHAEMHGQVPIEARAASAFAVTLEPSGGADMPSGPMFLLSAG